MPKGYEDHKGDSKKKPKLSLMEKRLRKREKKFQRQHAGEIEQHPDVII